MWDSDLVIISLLLILMAFHFYTKQQQVRSHTCCWGTSSHGVILIKPQKPVEITQWDQMNKTSLYSSAVEKTKNTTPQKYKGQLPSPNGGHWKITQRRQKQRPRNERWKMGRSEIHKKKPYSEDGWSFKAAKLMSEDDVQVGSSCQ